jgi:hypothetical protein
MAESGKEVIESEDVPTVRRPYENSRTIDNFIITKAFERGAAYSTDKGTVFGMLTQVLQSVRTQARSIADRLDDNLALMQGAHKSNRSEAFNLDNLLNTSENQEGVATKEHNIQRDKRGKTL